MKRTVFCAAKWFAAALLPLCIASGAHAQATRTWVSGVGDDANPCSRTAPCKTFAGAISKTQAAGEISVLDPGGYGAVTITKSITISGDGTLASILAAGTNGIIVNAGVNDTVILRNLSINGAGSGIDGVRFLAGAELHIDRVSIYGFTNQGIQFQPAGASRLLVSDTALRNNGGGGVFLQPTAAGTARAAFNRVVVEGNLRGLRADDGSSVVMQDSIVSGNDTNGIVAFGASRPVDVALENTVVSHHPNAGIRSQSLATVRISGLMATANDVGLLSISGGGIVSFRNNRVFGNVTMDGLPTASPGEI
jgi:hypothetical protein